MKEHNFLSSLDMNYYKAYHLDASEFAQCLCGFEPILEKMKKRYIWWMERAT